MSEMTLSDKTFAAEVLQSPVPVLVDFWAPWCGPCKVQAPILDELAQELDESKMRIGKLNVDDHPDTASTYNILSIPTLAIFKGGQVVEQFVGVQAKDKLLVALQKHAQVQ